MEFKLDGLHRFDLAPDKDLAVSFPMLPLDLSHKKRDTRILSSSGVTVRTSPRNCGATAVSRYLFISPHRREGVRTFLPSLNSREFPLSEAKSDCPICLDFFILSLYFLNCQGLSGFLLLGLFWP